MTNVTTNEGRALVANVEVRDVHRRALAICQTVKLLDMLHDDLLWTDSCSIA